MQEGWRPSTSDTVSQGPGTCPHMREETRLGEGAGPAHGHAATTGADPASSEPRCRPQNKYPPGRGPSQLRLPTTV